MSRRHRNPDPLRFLPSAAAVRSRLAEAEEEARKLRVLLDTIERVDRATTHPTEADRRQGVRHA